jgi:hypothetical protein
MSGSDFVHAHDTVVVTAPKPPAPFRAVTITLAVTRRCPGRRTIRLTRGGDVRRRWALPRRALCLLFMVHPSFAKVQHGQTRSLSRQLPILPRALRGNRAPIVVSLRVSLIMSRLSAMRHSQTADGGRSLRNVFRMKWSSDTGQGPGDTEPRTGDTEPGEHDKVKDLLEANLGARGLYEVRRFRDHALGATAARGRQSPQNPKWHRIRSIQKVSGTV